MGITVSDALRLPALESAILIAGHVGVNRIVSSVNMMEVPDIVRFVQPEEFLVTTTYPIRDNPEALERLIPTLVEKGVAALAIKPVFYNDVVPPLMIEQANALGFPLIQLPKTASFNEILNPILEEVLNRQAVILRRNEEVHARFTNLVLEGGSLNDIAGMLASLQNNPVSIHASTGRMLAFGVPDMTGSDSLVESTRTIQEICQNTAHIDRTIGLRKGRAQIESRNRVYEVLIQHIIVAGEDFGRLVLWLEASAEYETYVIEQAVTVIALELVKVRAVTEVERRFRSFFVEEIIQGKIKTRMEVVSRGQVFGWDLAARYIPFLIEAYDPAAEAPFAEVSHEMTRIQRQLWLAVSRATAQYKKAGITADVGARVMVLLRPDYQSMGKSTKDLAQVLAETVQAESSSERHLTVTVGIGRVIEDIMNLREGLSQAERALEIGRLLNGPGSITHFGDVGVYRLITSWSDNTEMEIYSRELLGELADSDRRYGTVFLDTLEALFRCNFNVKETARKMAVHYNTVRYRVQRIEQVAKVQMDSEEDRLNLQLAYRIMKCKRFND